MKKAKQTKQKITAKPAPKAMARVKSKPVARPAAKLAPKPAKVLKLAKPGNVAKAPATPPSDLPPKLLKLSKTDAARYRKLLLDLRDHLIDGVNFLASDNLKRSNREASGELSGYSLHMADAGTDNFDREFALSLVSNEQDALYEIEEALKRLEAGTYGVCEMCDKLIPKERLQAVPFARKCVPCQSNAEKHRRRPGPVTGIFSDKDDADAADAEESEE